MAVQMCYLLPSSSSLSRPVCLSWTLRGLVQLKRERETVANSTHSERQEKRKQQNKLIFPRPEVWSGVHGAALEGGLEQLQEGSARFVDGRGQLLKIIVYGVHLDVQVLKSNHVSSSASLGRVSYAFVPV
jgi:hypothetical protein